MAPDPALFLSTIILASAALVAIVGGLLVGRFVSIDSDQQGSQKLLGDAEGRLAIANKRAAKAAEELLLLRSHDFLGHPRVLDQIDGPRPDLEKLRGLAATRLTDKELNELVSKVRAEFNYAREALRAELLTLRIRGDDPNSAAAALGDLDASWPEVWRKVYIEIVSGEDARRRRAEEEWQREPAKAWKAVKADLDKKQRRLALPAPGDEQADGFLLALGWSVPESGSEIEAQREDQAVAAVERSRQRVEDLADEHQRLQRAHDAIVRPDLRLWFGVGVLVGFAAVGVGWPVLVMSRGPTDLAKVRWLVWLFLAALLALLIYVVAYLATIIRRSRTGRPVAPQRGGRHDRTPVKGQDSENRQDRAGPTEPGGVEEPQ